MNALRHLVIVTIFSLLSFQILAQELWLNGAAVYHELSKQKFIGGLYLTTASKSVDDIFKQPGNKELKIIITDRFSKRSWKKLWRQSAAINTSPEIFAALSADLEALFEKQLGGLQPDDIVTFFYNVEKGVQYRLNGVELANQAKAELFNTLLSGWIGDVPLSRDFKNNILGDSLQPELAVRLVTAKPNKQRREEITRWLPVTAATASHNTAKTLKNKPINTNTDSNTLAEKPALSEADIKDLIEQYKNDVRLKINLNIEYPNNAVRRKLEGSVGLTITLNRIGELLSVATSKPSPHDSLNIAAEQAAKKKAPFEPWPQQIPGETMQITVPVFFKF